MKTFLLLTTLILSGSMGEVLSAKGMKEIGDVSFRVGELRRTIARAVRNRWLIGGVFFMAVSFFSFLGLLSYADLSYVLPMTAVSYIVSTVGAKFFLNERITGARWLGTILVAVGVALVSLPHSLEEIIISYGSGGPRALMTLLNATDSGLNAPAIFWVLFALRLSLLFCVIASIAYYSIALGAGWLWFRDRRRQRALGLSYTPPVTILIPVRGADSGAYENFASFCRQDYPDYQIIFGARDEHDPAVAVIRHIIADFPAHHIELVISPAEIGHNAKVSNLQNMHTRAAHELLLIVDSDIRVGPDYLRRVAAPMQDQHVGMVTCLYRGVGTHTFGALLENIGISSTFAPEVVTARALEGIKFALGSTILTRRELLERIGGSTRWPIIWRMISCSAITSRRKASRSCCRITSSSTFQGRKPSPGCCAINCAGGRSTRISRPKGYAGLILTYGTATSLLLLVALKFSSFGWIMLGATFVVRLLVAWSFGVAGLKDRALAKYFWLVPLRDVLGFGIWAASFVGDEIQWRGTTFQVLPGGKIKPVGG